MPHKTNFNKVLPKISVIIPSFNQKKYIERTILSVINQQDPNLEVIVIDGNSKDGTIELLYKYQKYFDVLIIEDDNGQCNAINKGLVLSTGDWVCWQNSDDTFAENSFSILRNHLDKIKNSELIIGNVNLIDKNDNLIRDLKYVKPTFNSILSEGMIVSNQAAFWKRDLHKKIGYLNEALDVGFDFEWFLRLLTIAESSHLNYTLGNLRLHEETKSSKKTDIFEIEYQIVRSARKEINFKSLYLIRRLLYLFLNFEFYYIFRGFYNRISKLI